MKKSSEKYEKKLGTFLDGFDLTLSGQSDSVYIASLCGKFQKAGGDEAFADLYADKFSDFATFVKQKHRYHIINFDGSHPHTACCYMSSGTLFGYGTHLYVFEPNRGEFKVPAANIAEFFALLIYEHLSGGMMNNDMVAYRLNGGARGCC